MKLTINQEDIKKLKEKYGASNAVAGYVEEFKLLPLPLPNYYVAVIDDTNLTLAQMDLKFNEKEVTVIPLNSVESMKISGLFIKKIVIKTNTAVIKLIVRPLSFGIGDEQKALLQRFSELV